MTGFLQKLEKINESIPKPSKSYHKVYQNWIESYASEEYQRNILELREKIDKDVETVPREEEITFKKNFELGLRYEKSFFDYIYG